MKKHITSLTLLTILLLTAICMPVKLGAQSKYNPYTLDEATSRPIIKDNKCRNAIVDYQRNTKYELAKNKKLSVRTTRNEEVIVVSIPADLLFDPNKTELNYDATDVLGLFPRLMRMPDFYHMALAMYNDNSGSEQYCKNVTDKRLESIVDWFSNYGSTQYISYYSFGKHNPILPNNSIQNRRLNRRLEIYLIPGETMIEQAKKGLIK